MTRVQLNIWGRGPARACAGYVLVRDYERPREAVCRRIARDTGLDVITCRHDGSSPDADIYQVTLGRPLPRRLGGGWTDIGENWFSVPR